jgi:hypothetical protein
VLCHLKERRKKFRFYRCHPVDEVPAVHAVVSVVLITNIFKTIGLSDYLCRTGNFFKAVSRS